MVTMLDEWVIRMTNPPFSYIIIIILVVIGCYFLFTKLKPKIQEHFKGEGIDFVVKELNIKQGFKNFSRKCKKGKLYYNLGIVNIDRVMNTTVTTIKVNQNDDKKMNEVKESVEFVLFKTGSSIFAGIPILSSIFSNHEYFVINNSKNYIEKNKYADTWVIKPNVYVHKLADVWVCSEQGANFLTELIYKRTYENARESEMNYIKRVVWYNDKYANNMTSTMLDQELKNESYEKRVSRETGVPKR